MQGRLDAQIGRNRHHLEGARAGREDVKFDHDLLLLLELTIPFTGLISSLGSKQGRPKSNANGLVRDQASRMVRTREIVLSSKVRRDLPRGLTVIIRGVRQCLISTLEDSAC